eukprot:38436_1
MTCSTLLNKGIIKEASTLCRCCTTNAFKETEHITNDLTGQRFKIGQSSCFSKDIIYIIRCKHCGQLYVGKCGCGINNDRTFRSRTNEHWGSITKVFNFLNKENYFNYLDSSTESSFRKWLIIKKLLNQSNLKDNDPNINNKKRKYKNYQNNNNKTKKDEKKKSPKFNLTTDVIHFTGIDGSDCVNHCYNEESKMYEPHLLYESFVFCTKPSITQSISESKLCFKEREMQGHLCTIHNGLNDTKDINKT